MAVTIRFRQQPDDALLVRARQIIGGISGHPLFPDPDPKPEEIERQADAFREATEAEDGDAATRRRERKALVRMLRKLGLQVLHPEETDKPLFIVSGMERCNLRFATERDMYVRGFRVEAGKVPGTIRLSCMPEKGLWAYVFEYTADPEITEKTRWVQAPIARTYRTFDDLETGKEYSFRMAAIGDGSLDYTEIIRRYAP